MREKTNYKTGIDIKNLGRMMKSTLSLCILLFLWSGNLYAQSPVSFQVKAGTGISTLWGKHTEEKVKFAYKVGVGMEYAFNETWVLQPSLNFVSKGAKEKEENLGKATMNMLYIELPVMMAARFHLTKSSNLALSFGPYVAYGVGGKTLMDIDEKMIPSSTGYTKFGGKYKLDTFGSMSKGKMGCERFDAGLVLGISYETRRIVLGLEGQLGLVKVHDEIDEIAMFMDAEGYAPKNVSAFVTVGYKF